MYYFILSIRFMQQIMNEWKKYTNTVRPSICQNLPYFNRDWLLCNFTVVCHLCMIYSTFKNEIVTSIIDLILIG